MATKEPKGKPVSDEQMPQHKQMAMGKPVNGAKPGGGPKTRP